MKISYIIGILPLLILSACDEKTPSESTIKNQFESAFSDCKIISVNKIKKENGFIQTDGSYEIKSDFSISVSPTDDFDLLQKEYYESTKVYRNFVNDNLDKYNTTEEKMKNPKLFSSPDDYRNFSYDNIPFLNQYNSNISKIEDLKNILNYKTSKYFHNSCNINNDQLYGLLDLVIEKYKQNNYLKKDMDFSGKIDLHFVKSDNGWVLN